VAKCEVQLALAPDADRCFTAFQVSSLRRAVGAGEAKTLAALNPNHAAGNRYVRHGQHYWSVNPTSQTFLPEHSVRHAS